MWKATTKEETCVSNAPVNLDWSEQSWRVEIPSLKVELTDSHFVSLFLSIESHLRDKDVENGRIVD
jgi:hypothetical protein